MQASSAIERSNAPRRMLVSRSRPTIGPPIRRWIASASTWHGAKDPGGHRLLATADGDVRGVAGLDGVADEAPGRLADEDLARVGRLLQAGGDVDRVAGGPRAAGPRLADDHLAGVDADAHRDLERRARSAGASFRAASAVRISAAARTARRASSSWRTGTPKTATTASPMNFSTVPPWRSSDGAHRLEPAAHDGPQRFGVQALAQARWIRSRPRTRR